MNISKEEEWTSIIDPNRKLIDLKIREIYKYKDLLFLLVKRDLISQYKQTILGPLWYLIQPLLTTVIFYFIFGEIADTSPLGVPKFLFYMCGITCWTYFADCLIKTSTTFTDNANMFGKVYFPRIIVPLSIVVSNLLKFAIQLFLFILLLIYTVITNPNFNVRIELSSIIIFPLLLLLMASLGLGMGSIISSLTTKYRDLRFLIQFGIQLFMYVTPVVYPLRSAKIPTKYQNILEYNPMTFILESFRKIFLGFGNIELKALVYTIVFTCLTLLLGVLIFNRTEKNFMDTV